MEKSTPRIWHYRDLAFQVQGYIPLGWKGICYVLISFAMFQGSYLFFLAVFSVFVLNQYSLDDINSFESCLCIWVASFAIEEFRQVSLQLWLYFISLFLTIASKLKVERGCIVVRLVICSQTKFVSIILVLRFLCDFSLDQFFFWLLAFRPKKWEKQVNCWRH